jgi:hypothetical protein
MEIPEDCGEAWAVADFGIREAGGCGWFSAVVVGWRL